MHVTYSDLARAAAVAAILSGIIYVGIQFIHPEETLETATTDAWANVAWLTVAMSVLALIGIAGIYLRQVESIGVLGLVGFTMLSLFFLLPIAYSFAEATVLPLIAGDAPSFVENFLGLFNGEGTDGSLGALEPLPSVAGLLYVVGGVLLGVGIFLARVLTRGGGILLAVGGAAALLAGLVPHEVGRFAAIPFGLALIWLGFSLWSNPGTETTTVSESPRSAFSDATGT